jgi:hypothetical protein
LGVLSGLETHVVLLLHQTMGSQLRFRFSEMYNALILPNFLGLVVFTFWLKLVPFDLKNIGHFLFAFLTRLKVLLDFCARLRSTFMKNNVII